MSRSPCSGMLTGLCSWEQCLALQVGALQLPCLLLAGPLSEGFCKLRDYVTNHIQRAGSERAYLLNINGQIYQEQVRQQSLHQDCSTAALAMQQAEYHHRTAGRPRFFSSIAFSHQCREEPLAMQGRALNEVASRDCKVLVVGNPCNTNALICMENAPQLQRRNFHALMRLDENRARCQLAHKAQRFYTAITSLCVWGNHSTTQVHSI